MQGLSIIDIFSHASLVSLIVLAVLFIISFFSWAFIFGKWFELSRAKSQIKRFKTKFWKTDNLNALKDEVFEQYKSSGPLGRVFFSGIEEFIKSHQAHIASPADSANRAMKATIQAEIDRMESRLNYLATTGSVSPYIGLLGTVWGVMAAFMGLSGDVQNSIAAVAPGIAEALIATAVGLFAAIPAVIAYNSFANRIDKIANEMDSFVDELLNILQRQVK
ncbi:protein TolQ [Basilea psittacipulmonis]|uniref:Protein tolQ n=1 Tax=Basilea psittacipulmonis DSM 24701 TaxID=1072685 RepID=A0A077DFF2_9BURK|nr:protein TolQ [Basilea psittacipulmonis]AIL32881.1 protein tolQ [Basilea psittacipulmonis DSM 24701]